MMHLALFRSAINEANENHLAIGVPKDTIIFVIAHFPQQATQHLCMTIDIANEIVAISANTSANCFLRPRCGGNVATIRTSRSTI